MPALPPVADPTASMPPRTTGVLPPPASTVTSKLASNAIVPTPPRAPVRVVTAIGSQDPTATSSVKTSKSKKKSGATVTMATAATAQSSGGQSSGENTGRWTAEEHNLFLQGLELHGKGWKKIAGLIKSRTVVQIRTHAQKYFQKLAKAKQNGEDVTMAGGGSSNGGAVAGSTMTMMMGDGGRSALNGGAVPNAAGSALSSSSVAGGGHAAGHSNKRRKQTSGTKRKAIQSVVASARRQSKKKATVVSTARSPSTRYQQASPTGTLKQTMDSVAPALAPYVLPTPLSAMGVQKTANTTSQGVFNQTALEDSLFRYLTPTPVVAPDTQVNSVARQAGANPITLPTDQPGLPNTLAGGEVSPTGVNDLELYPTWTDYSKDTPSWYSKGADVDALLDVADTLDWLADTGDLNESYEEAERIHTVTTETHSQTSDFHLNSQPQKDVAPTSAGNFYSDANNNATMSMNTLPRIDSGAEVNVPPLPSLFDSVTDSGDDPTGSKSKLTLHMSSVPSVTNLDEHLFSSPIEEHDFVSTILDETGAGSSATLAALGATP